MKAVLRSIRISPKKVNLVAKMVRGKPADWAIDFLKFTPKHSAHALMMTLKSAVANAVENFKQKRQDLYVKQIIVNEGFTLKRFRPVSRGRSHPIMKRTSHITIEVAVNPGMQAAAKMESAKEAAQNAAKEMDAMDKKLKPATKKPATKRASSKKVAA